MHDQRLEVQTQSSRDEPVTGGIGSAGIGGGGGASGLLAAAAAAGGERNSWSAGELESVSEASRAAR